MTSQFASRSSRSIGTLYKSRPKDKNSSRRLTLKSLAIGTHLARKQKKTTSLSSFQLRVQILPAPALKKKLPHFFRRRISMAHGRKCPYLGSATNQGALNLLRCITKRAIIVFDCLHIMCTVYKIKI